MDSRSQSLIKPIKAIIGFLFVVLGFAMIIMPAPPYFDAFTLFYFSENDGVTMIDLVSLVIIAVGIYILVKTVFNFVESGEQDSEYLLQEIKNLETLLSSRRDADPSTERIVENSSYPHQDPDQSKIILRITSTILDDINVYRKKLGKTSSINLSIGIGATLIAVFVLVYTIVVQATYSNVNDFFIHYIPKLSFAIVLEFFAFFFFKLYRKNADDIKYFQNETNNINSMRAALLLASISGNKGLYDELIRFMGMNDRNKLIIGQREEEEISKSDIELLGAIKDLFKK